MSVRKRKWLWAGLAALVVVAALLFEPSATALGWLRGEPFFQGRSATAWRRDLRETDEVEAASATEALAGGSSSALPLCAWLLRNAPEPQVRTRAIHAIQKMGKAATPAGPDLVAALSDGDPLVRGAAARAIGDLAPEVPGAVPVLVGIFPDREAMRAVGEFKQAGAAAVPRLIELLAHGDPAVRRQAVRTLSRIGRPALDALPALIELVLRDEEPGVREFAAAVLGEFESIIASRGEPHPTASSILPALVAALADADAKVRLEAVLSLGRMEHRAAAALEELRGLADDPDPGVSKAAKDAVRKIEAKRK
jgi:HEAT repeat protein